jgi:hypothetical protein
VDTEVFVKTVNVAVADDPIDSVTVVGLRVAPGPPDTLRVRDTLPLKPLRLFTVMTELPEEPAGKLREAGRAEMPKSGGRLTVTRTVAECDSPLLEPKTLMEYVPGMVAESTEIDKVDVADTIVGDNTTLLGITDGLRPAGEISAKETVPENPLKPLTVTSVVAEDPA